VERSGQSKDALVRRAVDADDAVLVLDVLGLETLDGAVNLRNKLGLENFCMRIATNPESSE
jgi:hypothetical protein